MNAETTTEAQAIAAEAAWEQPEAVGRAGYYLHLAVQERAEAACRCCRHP